MKKLTNKLNPKNWSLTTRRAASILVLVINLAFLGLVFALASTHKGGVSPRHPAILISTTSAVFVNFLFIWLAVGVEKGYKRGLLFALAFLAILLLFASAAKLGIDLCVICMF